MSYEFTEDLYEELKNAYEEAAKEAGPTYTSFVDFLVGFSQSQNVGDFVFIDQDGGGEGGSEDCETVFKRGNKHYKVLFSYSSWEGYNFDFATAKLVEPVERMVTFYE